MIVKDAAGRKVDVLDKACFDRACYALGFNKGVFSQGRGYVSYHRDAKGKPVEYPVCWTRQLHGCPSNSVCPACRTATVLEPGAPCRCGGTTAVDDVEEELRLAFERVDAAEANAARVGSVIRNLESEGRT